MFDVSINFKYYFLINKQHKMDLDYFKNRIDEGKWDDDFAIELQKTKNIELLKYALQKDSCSVDLILDLWQSPIDEIRRLVCLNINTPLSIIKSLYDLEKNNEIRLLANNIMEKRNK